MSQDVLDDWIAFLVPTYNNREIARSFHVGQERVRAVRNSQTTHTQLLHRMGRPAKATPEITQVVIELTLQHPHFSDFQITQISE
jgi:hypothetical protein